MDVVIPWLTENKPVIDMLSTLKAKAVFQL